MAHAAAPARLGEDEGRESREELWTLYKLAIDDRNFQVNLNWDRAKHYFLFNFAALSIAGALGRTVTPLVQQAIFLLVALNAVFGAYSIGKGHRYYQGTRRRLKTIERRLGLITDDGGNPLAIKNTRGMLRETTGEPKRWLEHVTIVNLAIVLQLYIAAAAVYLLLATLR